MVIFLGGDWVYDWVYYIGSEIFSKFNFVEVSILFIYLCIIYILFVFKIYVIIKKK